MRCRPRARPCSCTPPGPLAVLDATTGRLRGWLASDDGGRVRAAAIALDELTLVIAAERGRSSRGCPARACSRCGRSPSMAWCRRSRRRRRACWSSSRTATRPARRPDRRGDRDAGARAGVARDRRAGHRRRRGWTDPGIAAARHSPSARRSRRRLAPPQATPADATPCARGCGPRSRRRPRSASAGSTRCTSWPVGYAPATTTRSPTRSRRRRTRGPEGSPLVITYGPEPGAVLVLDPRTGDPLRRISLPNDAPRGSVFSTIVDGQPVAGAVLAQPLRIVLF